MRALALLALAACASPRPASGPWVVSGNVSSEVSSSVIAMTEAARRVFPDSPLDLGGKITLAPDIDHACGYVWPESPGVIHFSGCTRGDIWVLWPNPKCSPPDDLACGALAHELGHIAVNNPDQGQADAAALLIVQEWRRGREQ